MTRSQFLKNTLPTVRQMAQDRSDPNLTVRQQREPRRGSIPWHTQRSPSPLAFESRLSGDAPSSSSRQGNRPPLPRSTSDEAALSSPSPYDGRSHDASELLVNAPHEGTFKSWEEAMEAILKEFYLSIRQLRLPLHGSSETQLQGQPSSTSLSAVSNFMRRTGSVMSKTPSELSRGRTPDFRGVSSRWSSKNRSRPKLYTSSTMASSRTGSRTSLDESVWSPTASSTWSRSLGNTQTTMSTDSLGSRFTQGDAGYQQSVGFASALSHAIIREEGTVDVDEASDTVTLDTEGLELAGAPWAKEAIVQHKHHLETTDKKAKDRNWSECFTVIDKGHMRLFSFNAKSSARSQRSRMAPVKGAVVGGGNWTENMEEIDSFTLRQTIANALPPPGYSKSRPHVFALSLPSGAVHLFQVGTPEIAREYVCTANYWSARLSKEPLVGGVSNVEYGWSDSVVNAALQASNISTSDLVHSSGRPSTSSPTPYPPTSFQKPRNNSIATPENSRSMHSPTPSASFSLNASARPSFQGSLRSRSSIDAPRPNVIRSRLPADRLPLAEWTPPQQSLTASTLSEDDQLEALQRYVHSIEEELARHNELRSSMVHAFSPRSVNGTKAMHNWERKSSYLLREIVKFRTYVDVLAFAKAEKQRVKTGMRKTGDPLGPPGMSKEDVSKENLRSTRGEDDTGLPEETMEALNVVQSGRTRKMRGDSESTTGAK